MKPHEQLELINVLFRRFVPLANEYLTVKDENRYTYYGSNTNAWNCRANIEAIIRQLRKELLALEKML